MTLSTGEVEGYIAEVLDQARSFGIYLFWMDIFDGRDELCVALDPVLRRRGVVPFTLRSQLLSEPNSWAQDVIRLIDDHREAFEGFRDLIAAERPVGLLVLAKAKLSIAQSSSPALLPSWFPGYGGRQVTAFARDVISSAGCSLGAPALCIEDICQLLYELELAMCKRYEAALAGCKRQGLALWDSFLRERTKFDTRDEFVAAWKAGVTGVRDARSFRPSLTSNWSLVAALWASFVDTRPAALAAQGDRFADFLALDEVTQPFHREPLLAILFRSTNEKMVTSRARLGRTLILLTGVACQLTTAAAHADQYGQVRATSAASLSLDLRDALSRLISALR